MTLRKVDKTEWRLTLDRLSRGLRGKQAEIEVAALHLGAQVDAEWLPLLGVSYDPKGDLVDVALDGLDHMIRHPRELFLDERAAGLAALEVVDGEGIRRIVQFRDPLLLPPPH
jgi:hypothetical protein